MATVRQGRGKKMDRGQLQALIKNAIHNASTYTDGQISQSRRKAMKAYHGDKYGNEMEGRSEFVSTDVQDAIETMMPEFMEIFGSGDSAVEFIPFGPEDEASAAQASDYINQVWLRDNPGWRTTYDWIKDAILQKNGIVRLDWDDVPRTRRETKTRIPPLEMIAYEEDDSIEIVEQDEVEPETDEERMVALDGFLYDVTIEKTFERGRAVVQSLPPEEFLINRRAVDIQSAIMTCHKIRKTQGELIEEGYPYELVDALPAEDEQKYNEERLARFNHEDEWPEDFKTLDRANRELWIYDVFLMLDYRGTGISTRHNVVCAGPGYEILPDPDTDELAMEVDDHPFVDITPIPVPHKFFGRSIYELAGDIQYIKTTIIRQLLDNMYFINNQRRMVNERVNLDDYLTNRPGGYVRVKGQAPVGDASQEITTQSIGTSVYPLMEFLENTKENRIGVTRLNLGKDAQSLNPSETLGGLMELLDQSSKRLLMMARVFAETGFKCAFKKLLRLEINNRDRARTVRLRGQWVEVDPRTWNADMDMEPRVGLGFGTRRSRVMALQNLASLQEKVVGYQGGVNGPMVTLKEVYEMVEAYTNALGQRPVGLYFREPTPEDQQMAQQKAAQPDPEVVASQAEEERRRKEMMLEHQRAMLEIQMRDKHEQARIALEYHKAGVKYDETAMQVEGGVRQTLIDSGTSLMRETVRQASQGNGKEASQ